ncbi:Zn-dependent oxidoreductase, NADPH:quinone reductase [Frankia casuarinae]|uniref:Alcohol dehydrogenase, zinc-binding n=2 Tax=Frankia casuarinae (strain DSM 45818 / CECT 9043 / HFP020203 / CcI3) TaxID=106370 RepID=Q2J6J1_FRACC|nr:MULTISPECIES: zinc-binding dehydrogenase [Frankia]ABD13101.1 Alcohol dehydrogenase, zinc-binding [Frankia casuarinae]ETA00504.1 Zn-dependent oxidoreductase, NADPH:quinone reductase [Frankia sp. CcI6]EYT91260.1 Zn-dependent oxidoreductase, NADPH:quinone reductase [Frankia casuarinae]KDA41813.1 Zn-dependent oxidoreductase, NADPH:quinone reductase [Frankia sp. BMG5.23]KEZ35394.1 Zn-dependent oxidoreductase, NADPH:quinone reductase [Frankia sp. CeD]
MLAAAAMSLHPDSPLDGLAIGEQPEPAPLDGWVTVTVRAASLNHHDLFSLRGVGLPADRLPMILGCDAAGVTPDGQEVIVHSVIGDPAAGGGDETLDPKRTLLSELYPGTLAERVAVPRRNLIPKPAGLSWEEAACLPTAWLTAYRMVVSRAGLPAGGGGTVLIQGAGGGVATAALLIAKAAGHTVFVTSRDETKRKRAAALGADEVLEPGARLPRRVDAVIETVGAATWGHSVKAVRPGGRIVVSGATSGPNPPADLTRIFFLQLSVIGSTMGSRDELVDLVAFVERTGVRPLIHEVRPLADARAAFEQLLGGEFFGKLILRPPA